MMWGASFLTFAIYGWFSRRGSTSAYKKIIRIGATLVCVFAATSLFARVRYPNEDLEMFVFVVAIAEFLPSFVAGLFGHFLGCAIRDAI
jgi:Na+/proline symporter